MIGVAEWRARRARDLQRELWKLQLLEFQEFQEYQQLQRDASKEACARVDMRKQRRVHFSEAQDT
eukprot:12940857-Heterocapsa_arctica.AAC.1